MVEGLNVCEMKWMWATFLNVDVYVALTTHSDSIFTSLLDNIAQLYRNLMVPSADCNQIFFLLIQSWNNANNCFTYNGYMRTWTHAEARLRSTFTIELLPPE